MLKTRKPTTPTMQPVSQPVVSNTTAEAVINYPNTSDTTEIPSFNTETISYTIQTEYTDNLVTEEYPVVPTRIIDNFFTDEEIDFMKSFIDNFPERNYGHTGTEPTLPAGSIERRIFVFNDVPEYEIVNDLISDRIKEHFHPQIIVGSAHILTAYFPYRAHGDAIFGEYGWNNDTYAAWTLIIPLDDYDSNTILFNEVSYKTKLVPEYIKDREPIDSIDKETFDKYFSLECEENLRYLSIDQVYKWEKARCFAASRYKFQGSDNFLKKNVPYKQALICWTALPKYINILDNTAK